MMRPVAASEGWADAVDAIVRSAPPASGARDPLRAQVRLLALLSSAAPLDQLLDGLAAYVETWAEGLHCTVLLVAPGGRKLVPGAAPSLPELYQGPVACMPIGEGEGSCGTAAARGEMVIVEDVEHSALWTKYAPFALARGLRACWSVPIFDDARTLLGTLALYYRERRRPTPREIDLIQFASTLAAFVIQRHRDSAKLRLTDARLEAAIWGTEIGLWASSVDGTYTWFDDWCERFDVDSAEGPDQDQRWCERIHPDDVERHAKVTVDAANGAIEHYIVEYRILTRSGRWSWLHERGKVTSRDAQGVAQGFVGVCFVIDEQKKLEAALRRAEDRYQNAIDAARLPVWEYDATRDSFVGNAYWHQALGHNVSDAEATQRAETWLSDIHPDDTGRIGNLLSRNASDSFETETRIRTAGGEYKWLLERGRVTERDSDGTPRRVMGVSVDIDERKRMETALRESEERFRGAFESAAVGMALVAPDGQFLRVNRALCGIVGYGTRELLGTTFQALTHPDDLEADLKYLRETLAGSRSHYDLEKRYFHRDGHIVWVLLSVSLVRDDAGKPLYFVGQAQDITARKQAEKQLIDSEFRYRTIANLVPGFVFEGVVRNGNPQPTWVSSGFERVYGCTLERFIELGGKQFYDEAARTSILAGAESVVRGADLSMDVSLQSLDGALRWLRVVARSVRAGPGDDLDRVLGVAEDITERKRLERALDEAKHDEQQRLGQEIHEGLAHELMGVALLARGLAASARKGQQKNADDLERLSQLASRTISLCHEIAQRLAPLSEAHGGLVQALHDLVDRHSDADGSPIRFDAIENAPVRLSLPAADHLFRIAQEALANALRHSQAQSIRMSLSVESDTVRLKIGDDGIGISPQAAESAGLGLKIIRYRAEMIHAQLSIGPAENGGTLLVCECRQPA